MKHTCIDVDVWCKWDGQDPPSYRVIVSGELLTERRFIWDSDRAYICEHMEVRLPPGVHTVQIQHCGAVAGTFFMENITIDGEPSAATFNLY
jgi:hypothetical protein